eukprot:1160403-Pelagomonas_calceolata.AAC.9
MLLMVDTWSLQKEQPIQSPRTPHSMEAAVHTRMCSCRPLAAVRRTQNSEHLMWRRGGWRRNAKQRSASGSGVRNCAGGEGGGGFSDVNSVCWGLGGKKTSGEGEACTGAVQEGGRG